jgi:hypothetical protein
VSIGSAAVELARASSTGSRTRRRSCSAPARWAS